MHSDVKSTLKQGCPGDICEIDSRFRLVNSNTVNPLLLTQPSGEIYQTIPIPALPGFRPPFTLHPFERSPDPSAARRGTPHQPRLTFLTPASARPCQPHHDRLSPIPPSGIRVHNRIRTHTRKNLFMKHSISIYAYTYILLLLFST